MIMQILQYKTMQCNHKHCHINPFFTKKKKDFSMTWHFLFMKYVDKELELYFGLIFYKNLHSTN